MSKYHFIKNKLTGAVIDIPDKHLEETLKRGEFEYVSPVADFPTSVKDVPIIEEAPVEDPVSEPVVDFTCVLCGYAAKSDKSLKIHKGKSHK